MDTYEVIITPDAEFDLQSIRDYLAYNIGGRNTALSQIRSIRHVIGSLQTMPARSRLVDEEPWRSRGIRKIIVGNYYVYYRIDDHAKRVYVLNVVLARSIK